MIAGSCHCGAVTYTLASTPEQLVDCNCSICRRYRALWAHLPPDKVTLSGDTHSYSYGDKNLAMHRCAKCGCVSHWSPLKAQPGQPWMGVNLALADPDAIAQIKIRRFDGAESWKFLDD